MSSSSASSTSGSSEPSSTPQLKRKRVVEAIVASDSEDSDSDAADETPAVEEPALSHAERRRQKKKEQLAKKETKDESTPKKRKLKDGTAAPVSSGSAKRQNSVWVGNMSFKTTQDNLKAFFDGVGEVTRIHMPTKAPNGPGMKPENRGFAYVDFATPEAKASAIARSEQPLLGRKLLIKDGDDFAGRPAPPGGDATGDATHKTHSKTAQKILRTQKQPPAPTLFVGNLGFETTEDAIRQLFEMHRDAPKKKGKSKEEGSDEEEEKKPKEVWIRKVRMGTFEDSGLCKGFAFVDFMTTEHATSALINPKNHHLNGRNLVVEYASAEAVRRGAPKSSRPVEAGAGHRPFSGGQKFKRSEPRQPRDAPPYKARADEAHAEMDIADVADDQGDGSSKPKWGSGTDHTTNSGKDAVRHKGPRVRPKPGAALALAKRESAAILPSRGQKITF